jgi:phage shock protein A
VELQLVRRRNFHLLTPRSSSQGNLTVRRRWDEKIEADKTWNNFKIHFAAAYRQHRQMQGDTVGSQGYTNAAVAQSEDDLAEQSLSALANLATPTAADRAVVAQLTEANSRLEKQLEDNATALK